MIDSSPEGEVALLAEGVDRNGKEARPMATAGDVALLAEGVDRNLLLGISSGRLEIVALLAEGVDRNMMQPLVSMVSAGRPPRGGRG